MLTTPFGTWRSPITAQKAGGSVMAFGDILFDSDTLYWSEMRPQEGGRNTIMKQLPDGSLQEVLPIGFSARSRVHEYGGLAFAVSNEIVYFINNADQRLHRLQPGADPIAITAPGYQFAECKITPFGIIAVAEKITDHEIINFLALIDPNSGNIQTLASGCDFYAAPACNKDFSKIAWICWDHPNMPWDDTQLWVADLQQQGLSNLVRIDADTLAQSFFQPQWSPDDTLVVVSDQSNWWNLYQVEDQKLKALFSVESEIGMPLWQLGMSTWGFYQGGIVCSFAHNGIDHLYWFKDHQLHRLDTGMPATCYWQIQTTANKIACIMGAPNIPSAIVVGDHLGLKVVRENAVLDVDPGYLSYPHPITFPSGDRQAYAYFYPPTNQDFQGEPNTRPPLIVKIHGGPTAHAERFLRWDLQYWTSRGFGIVDVNYTGSTGFGRKYRKAIEGHAGIVDVQDCQAAALYLVAQGLADQNALLIMGSSAGGYTALAALAFTPSFRAGAISYGVADLAQLAKDTHKFEAHYLDKLVGPYPEAAQIYRDRSPLFHADQISAPIIFFQGDEDKIVPPSQTESMVGALRKNGIPTELIIFKGEQHGFRKAEHRIKVLEAQKAFFLSALQRNH